MQKISMEWGGTNQREGIDSMGYTLQGLNITDIYLWNKAAIIKHLWNFEQ